MYITRKNRYDIIRWGREDVQIWSRVRGLDWIGLVPAQTGSGGKVQLLGISNRGDTYLRKLLIHGARSVLFHAKETGPWLEQIRKRRPVNVAVMAQANKMARTIWAILAHDRPYAKGYVSVKPV